MHKIILACDMLRYELELAATSLSDVPPIIWLDMKLHHSPEILRAAVQEQIDILEREHSGPLTILCGYGLCGRALIGVHSSRARLVFPRVHDCIPLFLGIPPKEARIVVPGGTLWLPPGMKGDIMSTFLEEKPKRLAQYTEKYGPKKAARLMAAEQRMFENYTRACYIRWGMGENFSPLARKAADSLGLAYEETDGSACYLTELLTGGHDMEKFLHIGPGETIDMNLEGDVCAAPCPCVAA